MVYRIREMGSRALSVILLLALCVQLLGGIVLDAGAASLKTVPAELNTQLKVSAYDCTYTDQWVPMFPAGQPDNSTTWPAWSEETNFGWVETEGYQDIGALHLRSRSGKNTGVAINAGMTAGRSYTLGLWAKGTSNSGKVLALYANGDAVVIGESADLTASWSYYEVTFTATGSQLNILAPDWGNTDIYLDNITLKQYSWSKDLLSGKGDFCRQAEAAVTYEPVVINAKKVSDAYNCRYSDCWVPMFPAGKSEGTWSAWDDTHYAQVVEDGCKDLGALFMKSAVGKNTGVTIQAGMTVGQQYTVGMWVKGTTNNTNKALALYGNGDGVLIGQPAHSPDGTVSSTTLSTQWMYVEKTFTALVSQLNIIVPDWGATQLTIDHITLVDGSGTDLLAGLGDFYKEASTAVEDANLDFELTATGIPFNWTHKGVLADSTAELYTENVYSGNQALRIHRQNGELDCTFLYSQSYIPVSYGDKVEMVAHIASRNSISGSFSMFVTGLGENGEAVDSAHGQDRITNAGSSWSQWDTYELVYTVPEGVKYLQFCIRVGGTNGDVLVDDLTYYNYTENNDTVYQEDFTHPSVTTGLPGGWTGDGVEACNGALAVSGSADTLLFVLRTGYRYTMTADVYTDGSALGTLVLEAVNWKGEPAGQAVSLSLKPGNAVESQTAEFTALSGVYYRLTVAKTGGSGSIYVDQLTLRQTGVPAKAENNTALAEKAPAVSAPTTTSSVETVGGKTYLLVNGEPVVPMWYARPENPILFEPHTVTEFARAGVDTVVTYVFLNNNYGDVWTKDGFASDAIDDMMLSTLAGNPDAKFIVALDFNAPQWWCEENPGELAALANSTPERTNASFASQKWKQQSGEIMLQAIDYMMEQSYADQIIGFKITGGYTLEWNWWATSGIYDDVGDFSQCGIAAFRQWLTEKYGTDSALQAAYQDSGITLQNAMPPSAEQRSDAYLDTVITVQDHPQMLDYELYMAELKAETIAYFAKLVKDAIEDRLVVGTYGGYFYMGGGYEFTTAVANVYFQRLLQSEYIDFIKSPWVYGMREIGDSAEFMGPVDSLDLYGKLWIVEDDTRLNLQTQIGKQDDNAAVGWTRNYQQSVEQLKRNFSYVLSKGMGISFYNLMWNFTDDAQYYGAIGQMYEEMERSLCLRSQSTADIAVFVDGQSNMLIPYENDVANSILYNSVFKEQLEELGHIGASYDMYLLDDLQAGLVPEHKINIFLGTTLITQEERTAIESQLQRNGNILVWIFTDGISDGSTTDLAHMESLTGMTLSIISTERKHNATAKLSNTSHWLTRGLNTNQPYGVETYDKLSPVIGITDSAATPLAYHTGTTKVAMAVKDMGDWTSVYSAIPNLPQSLFRNMLRQVGGHIYTDSPSDVIYANGDYVALHSIFAGERTVYLPEKATVYDVFRDQVIAADCSSFTVNLSGKETRLFRLVQPVEELAQIDSTAMTGAYSAPADAWTPMYPTGTPDNGTWEGWDDTHFARIVAEGCQDPGALYLKSYYYKNTGVAIDAGMTAGERYTLGLWAKGTSDSGRVLALCANGDPLIIGNPRELTEEWSYYEITFTAGIRQINLMASDWGVTDIYIDNITLTDMAGNDLLDGYGDFWRLTCTESHNFVEASCTRPKQCFACGLTSGDAVGHSYDQWVTVTPATLSGAGVEQKTCTACGDICSREIPCLAGDVEGWSLTLGGDLSVNFKMRIHPDIRQTAQVQITVAEKSCSYAVSSFQPDPVSQAYLFSVPVAAAQMGDAITVQIVNGNDASVIKTCSVLQYAQTVLADSSLSSYHRLVKEMLNYGAAAQAFFDYNADHPVNAGITGVGSAEISAPAEQEILDGDANVSFYGASLLLRDKICIRYYFTLSENAENVVFTVNGTQCEPVIQADLCYVQITDIGPQDLDESWLVSAGNVSVSYSPMNYLARMAEKGSEELKMLVKALYNYHLAAEQLCPDAR